jgi:hypothetical protein
MNNKINNETSQKLKKLISELEQNYFKIKSNKEI